MMLACRRLAPEIEEAVSEPRVLGIVRLAEHRQRQLLGLRQHLELLILTSTSPVGRLGLTVSGVRATTSPSMRTTHSGLSRLGLLEGRRMRIGHDLGQAVMVAQVDEQQPAMVAHAMHPARQAHGLADILFAQRAASMGAISRACDW